MRKPIVVFSRELYLCVVVVAIHHKVQKHTQFKMAAYLRGHSRWPLFFLIVYVVTDP